MGTRGESPGCRSGQRFSLNDKYHHPSYGSLAGYHSGGSFTYLLLYLDCLSWARKYTRMLQYLDLWLPCRYYHGDIDDRGMLSWELGSGSFSESFLSACEHHRPQRSVCTRGTEGYPPREKPRTLGT